ncbi:MAG: PAS domain S-box protein [bacterium]|nr:PAS domain S-box protein [bacterium]
MSDFHYEKDNLLEPYLTNAFLERISDGFVGLDSDWNYTYVNKKAGKLLGHRPDELIGKNIWEVFPEGIGQPFHLMYKKAFETQEVQTLREYYQPWKRWFENRIYPSSNGLSIFFTDITDQVKNEETRDEELRIFKLYNMFLDNSHDSFQVADENGYLVYVNDVGLRQLGISRDDVTTTHVCDFEDDFKSLADWQSHVEEMKECRKMIFESTNTNLTTGKQFPVEITITYETIDQVGYIIAISRDVTRRKEAELQLEQSQHLTANVLESMNDGFSMLDLEGNHLVVNSALCEMLGYEEHELIGTGVPHKYWPEEHLEEIRATFGQVMAGEKVDLQLKFKRKNGEIFPVIVSPSRICDDKGNVLSYISTVKDISDLQMAETKATLSEQRLRVILESTKVGIWDYNIKEEKTLRTIEHDRCFGFDEYHPNWNYETFINCIHPDDRELVHQAYQESLKEHKFYSVDYRVVWDDGSIHWLNSAGKHVFNSENEPVRFIGIVQDISDRKEKELLIQQSVKEKEALVAEVHHRVKNNLAVVAGLMYLQVVDTENAEVKDRLSTNMDRIKSIATIHEELYQSQDFSKISFAQYIRDHAKLLNDSQFTEVSADIHYDLQPLYLDINQALPCALIVNEIVSNAFKHAFEKEPDPKLWITLNKFESSIILSIRDNGCGIDDNFKEHSSLSMGLSLVENLSKQIDATSSFENDHGLCYTLSFRNSF